MDNDNLDQANKPKIYRGREGAAQWQIAAGIMHGIPNDLYAIKGDVSYATVNATIARNA